MILVIGIDAATWTVIRPNLDKLPVFQKLCAAGDTKTLVVADTPVSPAIWCGMFSGKTIAEHGHQSYVKNDKIVKREDIKVDFIWDILSRRGIKTIAINVPFVVPPYSFGIDFHPVGFGLPTNEQEWAEELKWVTAKTKEAMVGKPEVLIAVYTLLDRIQHFHWGEAMVLEWYRKVDTMLGELLLDTGFINDDNNRLIIISDHGFCSFGEAKVQTLPRKTKEGELKGEHHENAMLITVNVNYEINQPQDVHNTISAQF